MTYSIIYQKVYLFPTKDDINSAYNEYTSSVLFDDLWLRKAFSESHKTEPTNLDIDMIAALYDQFSPRRRLEIITNSDGIPEAYHGDNMKLEFRMNNEEYQCKEGYFFKLSVYNDLFYACRKDNPPEKFMSKINANRIVLVLSLIIPSLILFGFGLWTFGFMGNEGV